MNPIQLTKTQSFLGLGSNLNNPIQRIQEGRGAINRLDGVEEFAFSSLYKSSPMGPADQPDYLNAVMGIIITISASKLLSKLQQIEKEQGRMRTGLRWGPRTLDLDILLYGEEIIQTPDLVIPHNGIGERAFVLYPLREIAPDLTIPGKGRLTDMIERCPLNGLKQLPY